MLARVLKPCVILDGCDRAGDSKAIKGIGIEAVFHALQRFNQRPLANSKANSQSCQGPRLGERLDDQQIVVASDEGYGTFGAKIHIGLVNNDELVRMLGQELLDRLAWKSHAGGRVWIGQQDGAARPPKIGNLNPHRGIEGHFFVSYSIQAAVDRIEAVGNVGKKKRSIVLQQRLEGVGQNLIRPVPDEHLLRCNVVTGRDRLA